LRGSNCVLNLPILKGTWHNWQEICSCQPLRTAFRANEADLDTGALTSKLLMVELC
jgi:hypothetical protein